MANRQSNQSSIINPPIDNLQSAIVNVPSCPVVLKLLGENFVFLHRLLIPVLLGTAALIASYLPARRAMSVNPPKERRVDLISIPRH